MPLEPTTDTTAYSDPATLAVIFAMQNLMIDQSVRVSVAADAVQKLGGSGNPIEVVQAHRSALELIASTKFDQQGGGTEVIVREEDLA
jgi:hypothetical protein